MKKFLFILSLFLSIGGFAQVEKVIPARPSPQKLVNDFTNTLTPAQQEELERKLVAYDDSTSTQITVVIVKGLDGYSEGDYATALGNAWGVGGKQFNNGVVLLLAMDDHKSFIATGYGLEGSVPDATGSAILDNDIKPNFREQNYYRGIDAAITDIIAAIAHRYTAPEGYHKHKGIGGSGIFFLLILGLIILSSIFGRRGGGGGGIGNFGAGWIIGSMLGGGRGGGWSGGGGGGGGFGGFGGGGFGGGGASGSW